MNLESSRLDDCVAMAAYLGRGADRRKYLSRNPL
jgi:hypothetical protein